MDIKTLTAEIKNEGIKDAAFLRSQGNERFDRNDSTASDEAEKAVREFTLSRGVKFTELTEAQQEELRESYYSGMEQ